MRKNNVTSAAVAGATDFSLCSKSYSAQENQGFSLVPFGKPQEPSRMDNPCLAARHAANEMIDCQWLVEIKADTSFNQLKYKQNKNENISKTHHNKRSYNKLRSPSVWEPELKEIYKK